MQSEREMGSAASFWRKCVLTAFSQVVLLTASKRSAQTIQIGI